MKVCVFCKEEIRDEAIKCRYCASSLVSAASDSQSVTVPGPPRPNQVVYAINKDLIRSAKYAAAGLLVVVIAFVFLYLYGFHIAYDPLAKPVPASDQVTFVLDQDVFRFTKFAGAVLAIFITVGAFLYGFDIKQTGKEVQELAGKMRELQHQATITNDEILKAKDAVAADRLKSQEVLKDSIASYEKQAADRKTMQDSMQADQESTRKMVAEFEARLEEVKTLVARAREGTKEIQDNVFRTRTMADPTGVDKGSAAAPAKRSKSFSVPELARLYEFPTGFDGSGQCIGIIQLGGGYRPADLKKYFADLKLPLPKVTVVSIDGAKNAPTRDIGLDAQVTLNIEVTGAVAPGAQIVVYFAPNTEQGFLGAIKAVVADRENKPSVLAICWGSPETNWTKATLKGMNEALKAAAAQGITVVAAAGENGVTDGVDDGLPHVDFPASSPWVLACGGTRVTASGNKITSEVVWNDSNADFASATGGGVSEVFPQPEWQSGTNVPAASHGKSGRGLPDVAANASPSSGYAVLIHGEKMVLGGSTATVPFWAGLIAVINQAVGRNLGYINPVLYNKIGPAGVFRNITEGHNGVKGVKGYMAGPGWNACTGWGSPNGKKLLEAFQSHMGTME